MTTQSITSIGNLASQLQRTVQAIRAVAERHQIRPAFRINGIDHFSDEDAERIAGYLRRDRTTEGGRND